MRLPLLFSVPFLPIQEKDMQMLSTHEKHIKVTGAFQMYIFNAFDNVIDSLPYSNYLIEMQFEVRCGDELAPSIGKRFMSTHQHQLE